MTPATRLAIDRVDRIEPRVQERPERRKRDGKPFPEIGEDEAKKRAPAPRADADEGEDEHLVDLLVRGHWLPTGQLLPGRDATLSAS